MLTQGHPDPEMVYKAVSVRGMTSVIAEVPWLPASSAATNPAALQSGVGWRQRGLLGAEGLDAMGAGQWCGGALAAQLGGHPQWPPHPGSLRPHASHEREYVEGPQAAKDHSHPKEEKQSLNPRETKGPVAGPWGAGLLPLDPDVSANMPGTVPRPHETAVLY